MSVFRFHLRSGPVVFEDMRGIDFQTLADALRHGERDVLHLLKDEPQLDPATHWIEIADETGNVVRTVPFVRLS